MELLYHIKVLDKIYWGIPIPSSIVATCYFTFLQVTYKGSNFSTWSLTLIFFFIFRRSRFSSWLLYQFPRVALTNYQKRDGSEQQKFISLQFWKLLSPKMRFQQSWFFLEGEPDPYSLLTSGGSCQPLACGCITAISAFVIKWTCSVCLCLSSSKDTTTRCRSHPNQAWSHLN